MSRYSSYWYALALALLIWLATLYPYVSAHRHAPPGYQFSGQIAMANDTSMYFSFIHQAANGHWLFRNNLTYVPNTPVFFNPQWLLVGAIMSWFELGVEFAYQLWRAAGSLALALGFTALVGVSLGKGPQRSIALPVFLLGAGFSWALYLLAYAGLLNLGPRNGLPTPALDLIWGVHPFSHIMKNPHFSLPHGLFLLLFACFVQGERTKKPRWYFAAAGVAVVEGFSRPYDLITLWGVLSAFIALEIVLARRIDVRDALLRAVPLIATAPVLLYFVWLFSLNSAFKYWASQGTMPTAPFHWHILSFGLAFFLFAARLVLWKKFPLANPYERLFAVWAVVLFGLFHSYKLFSFMPYTPQLGVPLLAPMVLLGIPLLRFEPGPVFGLKNRSMAACAAALITVNALGSVVLLAKAPRDAMREFAENFTRNEDTLAFAWLNQNVREDDVILTGQYYGNRMSKYVPARIALGHWSVTPKVGDLNTRVNDFFAGRASSEQMMALLTEIGPRWVYVVRGDPNYVEEPVRVLPGMREVYSNAGVIVFKWETPA